MSSLLESQALKVGTYHPLSLEPPKFKPLTVSLQPNFNHSSTFPASEEGGFGLFSD